jgi:crotonobetainyl-CoA:carnitine CoA-transferase CaiB-like acyl-CoA transferase
MGMRYLFETSDGWLAALNPSVIVVSITNFGQTGPYSQLEATDLVGAAMGGSMYLNGDPERGPVRITAPQAFAQVNFQAAVGAMVALYGRGVNDGAGQHVDVSMQEAVSNAMDNAQATWDIRHVNATGPGVRRGGASQPGAKEGAMGMRYLFETSDGWLAALQAGGLVGPGAAIMIDWLASEGEAMGLDSPEWRTRLTAMQPLTEQERSYVEEVLSRFCKTRKKEDLVAGAQARGGGWAPVFSPREIVDSVQLAGRDYWVRVHHDDIGESFIYPGAPFKLSETPWAQRGRAPRAGEHNEQVYAELGLDPAELKRLRMRMVV